MSYHCTATDVRQTSMKYCESMVFAKNVDGKSTWTSCGPDPSGSGAGTVAENGPVAIRVDGANELFVI